MNKKDYIIIPGFGESQKDYPYKEITKAIQKNGSLGKIQYYNPTWDRKNIKNWIEDFEKKFKKVDTYKITLVGFSMGSYISILLAEKYNFKKVLIASLSPYFTENIKDLPREALDFMGKKRMIEFSKKNIPKKLKKTEVTFLFGDQDWPIAITQAKKLSKKYKGKFILIKNTGHELSTVYINKIVEEI